MAKKIEGLWDCRYCGQKGIGGLTKECPGCGHPQDEGIEFYMPNKKDMKVLDEETASKYGKGADWICSFCDSLNRYSDTTCRNCGADRVEQKGDYFSNKGENKRDLVEEEKKAFMAKREEKPKSGFPLGKVFAVIALAVVAFMIVSFLPKNVEAILSNKSWSRDIAIEEYKTVEESDWELPDGGRLKETKKEVHHMDQVLDHYETVSVPHTREVLDGYDTEIEYVNNGDGTYDEREVQVPRYKTETYYEDEKRAVYKDVPVYKDKYYYEIERWIESRYVSTEGVDDDPYWGEVTLGENEREGNKTEVYTLEFTQKKKDNTYTVNVSQDIWESLAIGDSAKITITHGDVTKINGESIEIE